MVSRASIAPAGACALLAEIRWFAPPAKIRVSLRDNTFEPRISNLHRWFQEWRYAFLSISF
jgi:hypothetical protein